MVDIIGDGTLAIYGILVVTTKENIISITIVPLKCYLPLWTGKRAVSSEFPEPSIPYLIVALKQSISSCSSTIQPRSYRP